MPSFTQGTQSANSNRLPVTPIPTMERDMAEFDHFMRPMHSIPANKWHRTLDVDFQVKQQKTPYSPPTQVAKGLTTSTSGGSFTLYDKTGGTKIFDYNPATGVITIIGSLVANLVSTGTYSNIIISGTNNVTGTITNGNYNNITIGTSLFKGGTINNAILGTPAITGGTYTNPTEVSGTYSNPVFTGTAKFGTTGTVELPTAGQFALQVISGTGVLVWNFGGTTYYALPTGTF